MPREFDFIHWIRSQQPPAEHVRLGIGDDLAVLNWSGSDLLLVGVDQILDGVHFDSTIHSPRAIGRKAMNRNLSDCAAMACLPAAVVVTFALPVGLSEQDAKELYLGIQEAGAIYDCPIVGGDTGSWPGKLVVTVTILGRSGGIDPVTRSGAKPGDHIYVTGALGGSIFGRHMAFEPRVNLARDLARNFSLHAMTDLSDGLGRDLHHICVASAVGANLTLSDIPIHEDVRRYDVTNNRKDAVTHAITDGEDYELLIVSPDVLPAPCIRIGSIQADRGLMLQTESANLTMPWSELGGWEHRF